MSTDLAPFPQPSIGLGAGSANGRQTMLDVAGTRAAQEVQAAMVIAQRFPRDDQLAMQRIKDDCKRPGLAERSQYAFPRGNETISGPSIRLAEAIARRWGNLNFGITELEQRNGESQMEAFCWDLETNVRATRTFVSKHIRTKNNWQGGKKTVVHQAIDDPRDIYEMTANQGARRLRACILEIIPGDVIDMALDQCDRTMAGDTKEPLADRIRKAVDFFQEEFGVTAAQLQKRLGHRIDATTEVELVNLKKIARSLKDNMAKLEDFFPSDTGDATPLGQALKSGENVLEQAERLEQTRDEPRLEAKAPAAKAPEEEPPATYADMVSAIEAHAQATSFDPEKLDKLYRVLETKKSLQGNRRQDAVARRRTLQAFRDGTLNLETGDPKLPGEK
jgi:hypothetical protein